MAFTTACTDHKKHVLYRVGWCYFVYLMTLFQKCTHIYVHPQFIIYFHGISWTPKTHPLSQIMSSCLGDSARRDFQPVEQKWLHSFFGKIVAIWRMMYKRRFASREQSEESTIAQISKNRSLVNVLTYPSKVPCVTYPHSVTNNMYVSLTKMQMSSRFSV